MRWFMERTDSVDAGFSTPEDVELLKLSAVDYRLLILDAWTNEVLAVWINQQFGLHPDHFVRSQLSPDTTSARPSAASTPR